MDKDPDPIEVIVTGIAVIMSSVASIVNAIRNDNMKRKKLATALPWKN